MLKTPTPYQHEQEMVTLESLVPADHLLCKIDAAVDFEFIRTKAARLETNAGTYANAVLVLNPGDFWNETDAPGAAWWAIGDGTQPT